jgi:hypothetical protein
MINKLNGWQRIFVAIAVIGIVTVYPLGKLKEPSKDEVKLAAYLPKLPAWPCESKNKEDCSVFYFANFLEHLEVYKVDGVDLEEDKRYTQQQVEDAAKRAWADAQKEHSEKQFTIYREFYTKFFLFLAGLYAFGWGIGWIKRGFKK